MSNPNPSIVAAYERALLKTGVQIIVKRVTGFAPNPTATVSATVMASVKDYQPDTTAPAQEGYAATKVGAITQGDRQVIVMATDLAAQRFPLPIKKNDRIILVDSGDELNVVAVDAGKRNNAGAIELKAASVA